SCPRGLLSVSIPVSALKGQAMSRLAGTETWAWVEEVYLFGAGSADLSALRRCPLLDQLAGLGFRRSVLLGPAGAQALAQWPRRAMRESSPWPRPGPFPGCAT